MVRDPFEEPGTPDLQDVLDALDDQDCRTIVKHLDEPMTAQEISTATDIPQSTTYRKLDLLSNATLVDEQTEIRSDGHHTKRYLLDVEVVRFALDSDRVFEIDISRPVHSPEERLAKMWSEVRKET